MIGSIMLVMALTATFMSSSQNLATRFITMGSLPVRSPAPTICVMERGINSHSSSRSEMGLPSLTLPATASHILEYSLFPATAAVICSPSRMPTPVPTMVAIVRSERARQALRNIPPMSGSLIRTLSAAILPPGVRK